MSEGKDIGREDPQVKIDGLPTGVDFVPYKDGENRGDFRYNDFAFNSIKPLFHRFAKGEPIFHLAKELGFGTVQHARHTLRNVWYLGYKHRTRHVSKKEWDADLNRFRNRGLTKHANPILIATNLAETPLVSQEIYDAVQDKMNVRKKEYEKRNNVINDFLASPLFHCKICGALMYPKRIKGKPDTYTCATRHRKQSCDEPIYRREIIDREVAVSLIMLLSNTQLIEQKIDESLNEDSQSEAQAKVAAKERIVSELEKKVSRVRRAIEDSDDPELPGRLKELNRELASARNDVAAAKEVVPKKIVIDRVALRQQIKREALSFKKKSMAEQKEILAKYVRSITAAKEPDTHDYIVRFDVKISLPTPIKMGKSSGSNNESRCSA